MLFSCYKFEPKKVVLCFRFLLLYRNLLIFFVKFLFFPRTYWQPISLRIVFFFKAMIHYLCFQILHNRFEPRLLKHWPTRSDPLQSVVVTPPNFSLPTSNLLTLLFYVIIEFTSFLKLRYTFLSLFTFKIQLVRVCVF